MVGDPGTRHAAEGSPGTFHKAILVLASRGGGNNLGRVCTEDLFDAFPHEFGVKVSYDPAGGDFYVGQELEESRRDVGSQVAETIAKFVSGGSIHKEEDVFDTTNCCAATKTNIHVEGIPKGGGEGYGVCGPASFFNSGGFTKIDCRVTVCIDQFNRRFSNDGENFLEVIYTSKANTLSQFIWGETHDGR